MFSKTFKGSHLLIGIFITSCQMEENLSNILVMPPTFARADFGNLPPLPDGTDVNKAKFTSLISVNGRAPLATLVNPSGPTVPVFASMPNDAAQKIVRPACAVANGPATIFYHVQGTVSGKAYFRISSNKCGEGYVEANYVRLGAPASNNKGASLVDSGTNNTNSAEKSLNLTADGNVGVLDISEGLERLSVEDGNVGMDESGMSLTSADAASGTAANQYFQLAPDGSLMPVDREDFTPSREMFNDPSRYSGGNIPVRALYGQHGITGSQDLGVRVQLNLPEAEGTSLTASDFGVLVETIVNPGGRDWGLRNEDMNFIACHPLSSIPNGDRCKPGKTCDIVANLGTSMPLNGLRDVFGGSMQTEISLVNGCGKNASSASLALTKDTPRTKKVGNNTVTTTGKTATKNTNLRDPLVLNFDPHRPIETIHVADSSVAFDLRGDGRVNRVGWLRGNSGFLVLDINSNGRIDNGREMLSDASVLASGSIAQHGFEALAEYDANGDGIIDARDPVFSLLAVWQDDNYDGKTDPGELKKLADTGVSSISLAYEKAKDGGGSLFGNRIVFTARFFGPEACGVGGCEVAEVMLQSLNEAVALNQ